MGFPPKGEVYWPIVTVEVPRRKWRKAEENISRVPLLKGPVPEQGQVT